MTKCDPCAKYHPQGDREAIATIEPAPGKTGHPPAALGALCLLNKLMYWHLFVTVTPLPGHEAAVAAVEAEAAAWRAQPRGGGNIAHEVAAAPRKGKRAA